MNNGLEHALFVDNSVFVNATKDSIQKAFVSACMRAANGGLDCNMPLFHGLRGGSTGVARTKIHGNLGLPDLEGFNGF